MSVELFAILSAVNQKWRIMAAYGYSFFNIDTDADITFLYRYQFIHYRCMCLTIHAIHELFGNTW